ncbi:MAG: membrane protein insertion efficiency factor YidD [Candidatus Hydrogenedentes bacterium]|nr:membrane protein insertion efficiency factor YidD [Candidatus Hydrogenedentota bacterium]
MGKVLVGGIRVYQRWISPLLGANCRFTPTCSQYAVTAIQRYGAIRGTGYALWRILRCNPFCKGGVDPVP